MSTPIQHDGKVNEPRLHGPPWAWDNPAAEADTTRPQSSQRITPGLGGPDRAVMEMRDWLSRNPHAVPRPPMAERRPPMAERRKSVVPWLVRLSFVVMGAALAAHVLAQISMSPGAFPALTKQDLGSIEVASPVAATAQRALKMARLVIENHQTFANEPLPLGISLNDAAGGEVVRLNGLARGTRLSPGSPLGAAGWLLSAVEIGKAMAYAPKDFVGAMDAAIELRSSSNELVDSQVVRLEWIAKPSEAWQARQEPKNAPVMQSLDPGEMVSMLKRGNDLLKIGNVASARLVLRRAANAGNAQAAMTLGMTYDPRVLAELGVLGSVPDASQARAWYQNAADLGSIEAQRRIDQLARVERRP